MPGVPMRVCAACASPAFPPRAVCPRCGSIDWEIVETPSGTVLAATEHRATWILSIQTDLGPVVVARGDGPAEPGERVALELAADGAIAAH